MPTIRTVVQTLTVSLQGTRASWLNSGLTLQVGEGLKVTATGAIQYHNSNNEWGYPEGSYADAQNGSHALDPGLVRSYSDIGINASEFAIPGAAPYALGMVLLPIGQTPTIGQSGAVTVPREWTGEPLAGSYFGGANKVAVWFLFNDTAGDWGDNSQSFFITLERYADTPQPIPSVRGGRTVPAPLLSILQTQSQHPAWCWVVQPVNGPWEFYTTLDVRLPLPAYKSPKDGTQVAPAATYASGYGVDLSTIPCTLKLESSGTDVMVVNFDRVKLQGGYYDGAEIEVFEVDWLHTSAGRWVAFSGLFGNAVVSDLSATLELATWDVAFETNRAETVNYSCSHNFCEGLCHNAEAGDGPTASDWTRAGEITAVLSPTLLVVQMSAGFVTNGARETGYYPNPADRVAAWASKLNEGMLTMGLGASSAEFAREVKLSQALGSDKFQLQMRGSFPAVPLVGDSILLRSGCTKMPESCKFYHNFKNYGGFVNLPLADGMRRF